MPPLRVIDLRPPLLSDYESSGPIQVDTDPEARGQWERHALETMRRADEGGLDGEDTIGFFRDSGFPPELAEKWARWASTEMMRQQGKQPAVRTPYVYDTQAQDVDILPGAFPSTGTDERYFTAEPPPPEDQGFITYDRPSRVDLGPDQDVSEPEVYYEEPRYEEVHYDDEVVEEAPADE